MKVNNVASRRAFLELMPTNELDEMLQAELRKENIDDDLVRLILDILESREADYPVESNDQISAAVEKYKHSLREFKERSPNAVWKKNGLLKVASILVVVSMLVFAVPQVVNAENIFDILARWTDNIFEFFSPGEEGDPRPEYVFVTDHPGLQQIYDTTIKYGITDPVVPMWVPDGYMLDEVKVNEDPREIGLYANMKCANQEISIYIGQRNVSSMFDHMKDENNAEILELNGIKHYIMSNDKNVKAIWITNRIECFVVADCQEDIYKILKSIYTMEAQ